MKKVKAPNQILILRIYDVSVEKGKSLVITFIR